MKLKSILKFFYLIIIFPLSSFAADTEFRISYSSDFHIPLGGIDPNEKNLQSETDTSNDHIDLDFFYGEEYGLVLGVGNGYQKTNYIQKKTASRNAGRFKSLYNSYYLRGGYWKRLRKPLFLELTLLVGKGRFRFENKNGGEEQVVNVYKAALDFKLIYQVDMYKNKFKLDIMFGGGYYHNLFDSDLELNQEEFNKKDDFPGDAFLSLGFGVRF